MGAISLDLNRERIREITAEAYDHIITALDTKINKTKVRRG